MASGLTVRNSGALRPAHRETVFCKTLVVGNSIAAYTATLAILQAGGQVCWAQSGPLNLSQVLTQQQQTQLTHSRFSWRWGRRLSPWAIATVMSQSQQAFWANWRPQSTLTPPTTITSKSSAAEAAPQATDRSSRESQLRQAIAPYLRNQQLILIPQGEPKRVLYSQHRGQRRVHQVVFQDGATRRRFQVHARLVLDATSDAALQQDMVEAPDPFPPAELILTPELIMPTPRQQARGVFFPDAVAIVMASELNGRAKAHPISVPLRSLVLKNTEGFLCVSLPGCSPQLRSIFLQPRAQWALGEAAGQLAARAAELGGIAALRSADNWQWKLQQRLVRQGIPIFAFDDVALTDPDFEAIQMVAIADVVRTMRDRDLSFRPETPITKAVLASALARLPAPSPSTDHAPPVSDVTANHWAANAIQAAIANDTLAPETATTFAPSKVLTKRQLWQVLRQLSPATITAPPFTTNEAPARRRHLSRALYPIVQMRLGK